MKLDFHKNHKLLFGTVFWGFVFLSMIIAVLPAMWVQEANEPLPSTDPMTVMEQKGLNIYVGEGCMYCHSQQVRPLEMDENWGRPSAPGDYARIERQDFWRQTPAVLGSARTGPDLTNVGKRQPSDIWHYMHLYNPRSVVEGSIMPSYPWLFEVKEDPASEDKVISVPDEYAPKNGKVVATEEAKALVAYLLSLKQASLTGPPAGSNSDTAGSAQQSSAAKEAADGALIYANNCSSCHQNSGQGVQGAFPPLAGDPVVTAEDPTEHIRIVLNGMQGEAIDGVQYQGLMQPFASILSDEEVAAVVNHERTSWGNDAPTVTAKDVAKVRENSNSANNQNED
ncbi:MAG: cytochrome c [Balneolaceae bacterium]|nr:cytochrome c [Balneolaceae bacterium]